MSVLHKKEIRRRIKLPVYDSKSIVITPLINTQFDHDAVDLSLGCYFRLPALSDVECIKPFGDKTEKTSKHYPELIHKPYRKKKQDKVKEQNKGKDWENSILILQPHHSVLASSLEYIKLPGDLSGQILTKSSWARVFISIASAPWIHPFYRGCLTLEICNLGNVPVALPIGEPIAQLIFLTVDNQEDLTDQIEGKYAGAVMPEAPKF